MRTEDQDHVVARIAVDMGFPPEVVRESYIAALAELSADASVHIYLPLFAAKRTIARLRSAKSESANQTHSSNLDAARDEILSGAQVAFAATPNDCSHPRPRQTRQQQGAVLA
ncbi:DUF3562 domain-containing protein [Cupriavidus sp. BIC8F]|uniref:DUF3562 domain-containing protein n=1 Tax=Cupriavidus sp. BIC8F TaxID=3079014 RepID=UPI003967B89A